MGPQSATEAEAWTVGVVQQLSSAVDAITRLS